MEIHLIYHDSGVIQLADHYSVAKVAVGGDFTLEGSVERAVPNCNGASLDHNLEPRLCYYSDNVALGDDVGPTLTAIVSCVLVIMKST